MSRRSTAMTEDISELLNSWAFDPENSIRRITGADGKTRLQVRLPLGIEQYELEGRPDGKRPNGFDSLLDYYETSLAQYRRSEGNDIGFSLSTGECHDLQEEGTLYYYRYLLCYQLGEYELVRRDTERNMRLFRFVGRYAASDEDKKGFAQYWPYLLRMNATARALQALELGDSPGAMKLLHKAKEDILNLRDVDTPLFAQERERSLAVLDETLGNIEKKKPPSEKEQLKRLLEKAIEAENYEQAAKLRDMLTRMSD
jgi:hypothetical protein